MKYKFKRKLANLRDDPHMREVARGTMLAFALKIIGSGLAFGFNVAIARLLGAEGTGVFFLAFSVVTIATVVSRLGMDNAMLRFIASYAVHGQWQNVNAVYRQGLRLVVMAAALITLLLLLAAPWLADLLAKPELLEPLRWMALAILPVALLNIHAECLKGLKRIRDALLVQGIGLPLLNLLLIFPLIAVAGIVGAALAYAIGAGLVMLLGFFLWQRAALVRTAQQSAEAAPEQADDDVLAKLWESAAPLWLVSLMNRGLMPWAPIILLGLWLPSADVGIFSAATRVAMLVSFILVVVNNVVAPKFAELYAQGDMQNLGSTARRTGALMTLLVAPVFILLLLLPGQVMALFGEEFIAGGSVLAILLLGQFVNVFSGSVGYLLMMSGNEKHYRNITMLFAVVQMLLIILLAPAFGMIGAAIAVACCLAGVNLLSAYVVYQQLGVVTIPGLSIFFRRGNNE